MTKLAYLLIGIGGIFSAFAQTGTNSLKGAWQLTKYDHGGGRMPTGTKEVKLITDKHFAWITYDSKGKTLAEGGGTYTFNGTTLIEHLEYADSGEKNIKNKDQVLTITFDADTFTSTGTLTNGIKITEVWKRIE